MESQRLTGEVQRLRAEIEAKERRMADLRRHCVDNRGHDWGEVRFDPKYRAGYTIPSDIEQGIYLGVDTRVSSTYVPAETTNEWVRQCIKCGTEERTQRTKTVPRAGRIPGTSCQEQVPVFPGDR